MKVREILLELSEVLNRQQHYGYWIEADTGKLHPVQDEEHVDYMKRHLAGTGDHSHANKPPHEVYDKGFEMGWVRVNHNSPYELNVQGKASDIQQIARILAPTIAQREMESAYIDKVDTNKSGRFDLPEERRSAIQFINKG